MGSRIRLVGDIPRPAHTLLAGTVAAVDTHAPGPDSGSRSGSGWESWEDCRRYTAVLETEMKGKRSIRLAGLDCWGGSRDRRLCGRLVGGRLGVGIWLPPFSFWGGVLWVGGLVWFGGDVVVIGGGWSSE